MSFKDITTILSTSTLSMKIFISKFLEFDIPILKMRIHLLENLILETGATDYYQLKTNIHYYDVNSLYPFYMTKPIPMPFDLIRKFTFKEGDNFNLDKFFGFFKLS